MAPRKTTKPAEVKKAVEPKTKKTTKTTKPAAKPKTTVKTKKVTSKKKPTEDENSVTSDQEQSSEQEYSNHDASDGYVDYQENEVNELTEEVPLEETNQEHSDGEDHKSSLDDEKINANRIFITRIAFEATKDDLEDYFKKFGTVYDAYCPRQNNYSGLNKGFGFISFENEDSIRKVFESGPHVIMGREVIVDRATGTKYHSSDYKRLEYSSQSGPKRHYPPPHRRFRDYYPDSYRYKRHYDSYPDYPSKYPRRERHYERDSYYQSVPPYRQSSNSSTFDPNKPVSFVFSGSRNESRNEPYSRTFSDTPRTYSDAPKTYSDGSRTYSNGSRNGRDRSIPKLFVGRIAFETSVHSLRTYFSQFGEVIDVYIPKDPHTQKGKGFGFITFANKNSIHSALDPSLKHVVDGREIIVDYADVHSRRI